MTAKNLPIRKQFLTILRIGLMNLSISLLYIGQKQKKWLKNYNRKTMYYKNTSKNSSQKKDKIKSQMQQLQKSSQLEILIVKSKAYWVYDNILYEAEIHKSGEILTDEAKPVDVINMKEKDLNKIIKIVDYFNE